jgi:hypothetical protein
MPQNESDRQEMIGRANAIRARYEDELLAQPGVVGVGVGLRTQGGEITDQVALVVLVHTKLAAQDVPEDEMLPSEIEGIPVDVQQVGEVRAG